MTGRNRPFGVLTVQFLKRRRLCLFIVKRRVPQRTHLAQRVPPLPGQQYLRELARGGIRVVLEDVMRDENPQRKRDHFLVLFARFPKGRSVRHKLERRPNAIGRIGLWQSLSYLLRREPASAMSWDNHSWIDLSQCFNRLCNDGLEQGSCQMKSPQYGINLLNPCLRADLV